MYYRYQKQHLHRLFISIYHVRIYTAEARSFAWPSEICWYILWARANLRTLQNLLRSRQYNDRCSHVFCSWTSSADVVVGGGAGTGELPRNMHFRVFVVCSVKLRETIMFFGRCYNPYYMQFAAHSSLTQLFHAILNEKYGAFSIANTPMHSNAHMCAPCGYQKQQIMFRPNESWAEIICKTRRIWACHIHLIYSERGYSASNCSLLLLWCVHFDCIWRGISGSLSRKLYWHDCGTQAELAKQWKCELWLEIVALSAAEQRWRAGERTEAEQLGEEDGRHTKNRNENEKRPADDVKWRARDVNGDETKANDGIWL